MQMAFQITVAILGLPRGSHQPTAHLDDRQLQILLVFSRELHTLPVSGRLRCAAILALGRSASCPRLQVQAGQVRLL